MGNRLGWKGLIKLHWKERSQNKVVRSGDRTKDLMHQGRALADCAALAPQGVAQSMGQMSNILNLPNQKRTIVIWF